MYFVVMPRVNLIVILMTYVRYIYSINCPVVICLPSMCYLSYGETPLVNCGPRSNFLYIALPFTFTRSVYFTCILMTHKYRGCIVVLLINKSVEANEEQKVLTSSFDQGFTVNTSK
jgi:hypothetical protein